MEEKYDLYRKLEPFSRILRALGIPPVEAVIPTPREVAEDLGIPTLEDILPKLKEEARKMFREAIRSRIKEIRRE